MFVYNQVNGGSDRNGTSFYSNFGVLESQGDVEAADWTQPFEDYLSQPTADERADAAQHVLSAHTTLFAAYSGGFGDAGRTAIETALANNQPVGIGMPVYEPFFYLTGSDDTFTAADATGPLQGWHAVTVLGYDASGVTIENSWGTGWGNHGFAKLGWDFVEAYVREAYAAGTFQRNALIPSVTSLSSSKVTTTGATRLAVSGLRLGSVDVTKPNAVSFVSVADPSVVVPAVHATPTASGLSVLTPPLAQGQWRVVVTNANGSSVPNGTADVVDAAPGPAIGLSPDQHGRSDNSTWLMLTGSGFPTSYDELQSSDITVTVGDDDAYIWYFDATHLQVYAPAEPNGTRVPVVVWYGDQPSTTAWLTYGTLAAPAVTAVTPARVSTAGGTRVTVSVADGSTLGTSPTVTLVSTADPSVRLAAPVVASTAGTLTVTVPAAPGGRGADFHVVVSGPGGDSAASARDLLGYRTPVTGRPSVTTVSATGAMVTLTGTGFGTSATAFAAQRFTATAAGRPAALRWLSNTAVVVTVPAGTPGTAVPIVLLHDGLPGAAASVTRAAVITRNSAPSGVRTGWTTTLTGVGFTRAGGWALINGSGRTVALLPVVSSTSALRAARHGAVLISSATSATVTLPTLARGSYRLSFAPDQRTFPHAKLLSSTQAVVVYR
jgi:hypothetical protein